MEGLFKISVELLVIESFVDGKAERDDRILSDVDCFMSLLQNNSHLKCILYELPVNALDLPETSFEFSIFIGFLLESSDDRSEVVTTSNFSRVQIVEKRRVPIVEGTDFLA